ncbi:MAG TPA: nucleotide exchange factor GrpE [Capillimicrobium sp.]|jgi:molecular chaperone GrpE
MASEEQPITEQELNIDEAGAEAPASEAAVEQDLSALQEKAAQRDEYLALAQRAQADFDNYRKRMARDVAAAEGRGMARVVKELLPALDNLERAIASAEAQEADAEHHLTKGIRLVQQELAGALERVGIEAFSPKGELFDPNEHEAMVQQPVEGAASGTVVEVYQQGYRLNGSVLRPARVVVAA